MDRKPIVLSRACIQDTLLMKRLCPEKMVGLALSLYNLNVQTLRRGQLAPHVEKKMLPNRYLEKQRLKRVAPDIVITVRGGLVQEVRSTNPFTTVYIADYDLDSPDENAATEDAEERGNWSTVPHRRPGRLPHRHQPPARQGHVPADHDEREGAPYPAV